MKIASVLLAVFLAGCAHRPASIDMARPDGRTQAVFMQLRADLQVAIRDGNRAALEWLLARSFVFVHSTGKLESRDAFIARMTANAGRSAPEIEFLDHDIRLYGTTAVWITHSRRPGTPMAFVGTDVLVHADGRWQWVSVQSTRTELQDAAGR
jgi:hypothetical protein